MSNTIYSNKKSTKKFHYTYQIVELSTNKKYIGVRSSDIEPRLDIGHVYFSSSSDIKFIKRQKEFPNDYEYIVLSIHESREDANKEEMYLHEKYDVASSINFYNIVNSGSINFNRVGMAVVRDKDGNIFQASIDDERYLSGDLVHNMVGKKLSEEHKANISKGSSGENNGFYGKTHEDYVLDIVSNLYEIDGRIFRGRKAVAELYNICEKSVTHRCKSANYPNWILIKPRK